MKHCHWCDNVFEAKVRYQIYCTPECRNEATKFNIAEKYKETRRKNRKPRKCKSCGATLSSYNDTQLCSVCSVNPIDVAKALREIKGFGNGKSSKDS